MFKKSVFIVIVCANLTGCSGVLKSLFEPRHYGVRESQWNTLSSQQQSTIKREYQIQQQELARQIAIERERRAYEERLRLAREQEIARQEAEYNRREEIQRYTIEAARLHSEIEQARQAQEERTRLAREEDRQRQEALNRSRREHDARIQQQPQHPNLRETNTIYNNNRSMIEQERRAYEESVRLAREEDDRRLQEALNQSRREYEARIQQEQQQQRQPLNNANNPAPRPRPANAEEPNEGDLVAGGRHVMNLQRHLNRQPSFDEMVANLTTTMNISSEKAKKIIEALGLD